MLWKSYSDEGNRRYMLRSSESISQSSAPLPGLYKREMLLTKQAENAEYVLVKTLFSDVLHAGVNDLNS